MFVRLVGTCMVIIGGKRVSMGNHFTGMQYMGVLIDGRIDKQPTNCWKH